MMMVVVDDQLVVVDTSRGVGQELVVVDGERKTHPLLWQLNSTSTHQHVLRAPQRDRNNTPTTPARAAA